MILPHRLLNETWPYRGDILFHGSDKKNACMMENPLAPLSLERLNSELYLYNNSLHAPTQFQGFSGAKLLLPVSFATAPFFSCALLYFAASVRKPIIELSPLLASPKKDLVRCRIDQ